MPRLMILIKHQIPLANWKANVQKLKERIIKIQIRYKIFILKGQDNVCHDNSVDVLVE